MYRFNGMDGRLNRMLETTCLIFESMEGLDRYAAWPQRGGSMLGGSANVKSGGIHLVAQPGWFNIIINH